jgi:CubicO group peptidase (beta-lactamase class C family)
MCFIIHNALKKVKLGIWLVLFGFNNLRAQIYFPPINSSEWDTISPNRLGFCEDRIDSLYQFLENQNSKAFILLKDGKVVLESYFNGFSQDSFWYWASAGKTLTASVVGILQGQGKLKLTDPTNKFLGNSWTSLDKNQEDSINIWHQLTMTSGLDDVPSKLDCTDPSCLVYKAPVGSRWAYHNAPYTLLDKVIEAAAEKTLNQVVFSELTQKIGLKVAYFKIGNNNVAISTPRNFARFGLLLLAQGKWNDQTIIPNLYFKEMTETTQTLNISYGYLTWLNGKKSFMAPQSQIRFPGSIMSEGPSDLFMALGRDGQQIHVVPSQNMVWIRMGEAPNTNAPLVSFDLGNDIWKMINKLNCANMSVTQSRGEFEDSVFPNPVYRGQSINIQTGLLIDHVGRTFSISNGVIPADLCPGLYHLQNHGGSQKLMVLE